jgi:putative transposase
MNELAAVHPRYGYRRIWALLREGWQVNRKRGSTGRGGLRDTGCRRGVAGPRGKKAQGTADNAVWNRPAARPNQIWSYDFMSGRTRDGASLRILNVVDE